MFGAVVIGPPGVGKSTLCQCYSTMLDRCGYKVSIVNLDPANDQLVYQPAIDVCDLVKVDDVMEARGLGPNGALVHCMEVLDENESEWLEPQLSKLKDTFVLIDMPGQVELYTQHRSVQSLLEKWELRRYRVRSYF